MNSSTRHQHIRHHYWP